MKPACLPVRSGSVSQKRQRREKPPEPPPPARPGKHRKGELTPRQVRFTREMAECGNATEAAKRAGYSRRSAHVQAQQLLAIPCVADEVARCQARILRRLEISAEKVLDYQARSAFFDPRELVDERGRPIKLQDLPEHIATALTGVDLDSEGRVLKARWDRTANSTNLAKNQRLLTERHEHVISGALSIDQARGMSDEEMRQRFEAIAVEAAAAAAELKPKG